MFNKLILLIVVAFSSIAFAAVAVEYENYSPFRDQAALSRYREAFLEFTLKVRKNEKLMQELRKSFEGTGQFAKMSPLFSTKGSRFSYWINHLKPEERSKVREIVCKHGMEEDFNVFEENMELFKAYVDKEFVALYPKLKTLFSKTAFYMVWHNYHFIRVLNRIQSVKDASEEYYYLAYVSFMDLAEFKEFDGNFNTALFGQFRYNLRHAMRDNTHLPKYLYDKIVSSSMLHVLESDISLGEAEAAAEGDVVEKAVVEGSVVEGRAEDGEASFKPELAAKEGRKGRYDKNFNPLQREVFAMETAFPISTYTYSSDGSQRDIYSPAMEPTEEFGYSRADEFAWKFSEILFGRTGSTSRYSSRSASVTALYLLDVDSSAESIAEKLAVSRQAVSMQLRKEFSSVLELLAARGNEVSIGLLKIGMHNIRANVIRELTHGVLTDYAQKAGYTLDMLKIEVFGETQCGDAFIPNRP